MSLPAWRNGILGPERAIQEMTTGERRAGHARDSRDASAERRGVRAASAHAKREHAIEHCSFGFGLRDVNKKKKDSSMGALRTCGYERFGRRLAGEMGERERGTHALERAEVAEDHRGLAGSEAEDGLVGLAPFFVEQPRACRRLWTRWALWGAPARAGEKKRHRTRKYPLRSGDPGTYAFVFLGDLDETQLEDSFEKPSASVGGVRSSAVSEFATQTGDRMRDNGKEEEGNSPLFELE